MQAASSHTQEEEVPIHPAHMVSQVGTIGGGGSSSSGGTQVVFPNTGGRTAGQRTSTMMRPVTLMEQVFLNEVVATQEERSMNLLQNDDESANMIDNVNQLCVVLVQLLSPRMKYTMQMMLTQMIIVLTSFLPTRF